MEHSAGDCSTVISSDERARRIARRYLPSREAIAGILHGVLDLMYPGYFGRRDLDRENLGAYVSESLAALAPKIEREMEHCLCYGREREPGVPKRACRGGAVGIRRMRAPRAGIDRNFPQPAARDPRAAGQGCAGGV